MVVTFRYHLDAWKGDIGVTTEQFNDMLKSLDE